MTHGLMGQRWIPEKLAIVRGPNLIATPNYKYHTSGGGDALHCVAMPYRVQASNSLHRWALSANASTLDLGAAVRLVHVNKRRAKSPNLCELVDYFVTTPIYLDLELSISARSSHANRANKQRLDERASENPEPSATFPVIRFRKNMVISTSATRTSDRTQSNAQFGKQKKWIKLYLCWMTPWIARSLLACFPREEKSGRAGERERDQVFFIVAGKFYLDEMSVPVCGTCSILIGYGENERFMHATFSPIRTAHGDAGNQKEKRFGSLLCSSNKDLIEATCYSRCSYCFGVLCSRVLWSLR